MLEMDKNLTLELISVHQTIKGPLMCGVNGQIFR